MQIARRVYVYLLTGISLGTLVTGLMMLLGVLLTSLGLGASGEVVFGGDQTIREQLTVAAALTAVSLPVWLIHWTVAQRSIRAERPGSRAERNSPERGLFFALALAILLIVAALGLASLIEGTMLRLVDAESFAHGDLAGDLARTVVTLGFWAYHLRVGAADWNEGGLTHQAAFLPRAYRYVAAFIGLLVLLFSVASLLEVVGRVLLDEPIETFGARGAWWADPLARAVSGVIVGGAVWIGHWAYSGRLMADRAGRGASERTSRLRLAFYIAVFVATASITIYFIGEAIGTALEIALGVATARETGQLIGLVGVPLASAIGFGLAWWIHARWLDGEPIATDRAGDLATSDRLRLYPVALVGLAYGAIGFAWLIGLLIDGLLEDSRVAIGGDLWQRQLAQFAPYAVLGWTVWIWRWVAVSRRWTADPLSEGASTTRRATLLIVLAVAVLAGIGSAGVILYRLFGSLFGITMTGSAVSELSLPIGILLVAVAVALGHGLLLRRDQELRDRLEADGASAARTADAVVRLRLSGPSEGIEGALATLGGAAPSGYRLEIDEEAAPGP